MGDKDFNVKLQQPELIAPETPTPLQAYFLSNLDLIQPFVVKTLYLFQPNPNKAGEDPAHTIKQALRKVLVYYYPLAGRLETRPDGRFNVQCDDQGVAFVAADADTTMSALGDLLKPHKVGLGKLVYQVPDARDMVEMPLVTAQVTKFECGGFVLGLAVNHFMFDGIAAMEFLNSWAETARGIPLSIPPATDRSLLRARVPPQIKYPHTEFLEIKDLLQKQAHLSGEDMVFRSFCFSPESLEKLKKLAMEDGSVEKCTTFEVLAGLVWRCRTMAMGIAPEHQTKLMFSVDGRDRIEPPMPRGYMGNVVVIAYALTTTRELAEKPLSNAVKKVQQAIASVRDDYIRSAIDYIEVMRPTLQPSTGTMLMLVTWSRLAFNAVDFGWGEPTQTGQPSVPQRVVVFVSRGRARKTMNVCISLPRGVMEAFEQFVQPLL